MTVIISYICFLPFRKLPPGRHRSGKRADRTMVLIHSQSAASIGSSVSSDTRRARPRKVLRRDGFNQTRSSHRCRSLLASEVA